jgi:hypothetical protein
MSKEEIFKHLVTKMLEPYGVDYDYVKANPEIEGMPWYNYFSYVSAEHEKDFEEYFIKFVKKHLKHSQKKAEMEYAWFNLMNGLKSYKPDEKQQNQD